MISTATDQLAFHACPVGGEPLDAQGCAANASIGFQSRKAEQRSAVG